MTDTSPSPYLDTDGVAAIIGMSPEYVRRQCKAGAIKAKKLGTEWRIHRAALEQFMGTPGGAPAAQKRSARQIRRSA